MYCYLGTSFTRLGHDPLPSLVCMCVQLGVVGIVTRVDSSLQESKSATFS